MAEAERIPRVLVVDDEPNIRELVQVALKFHGCTVSTASNGTDAIRQAEATAPDLIVLDVMLPDIDGFEVCRRLRAAGNEVPVIFLTARDTSSDTVTGLAIGGDDYVTKPFSVEALVARVRAVLRRASRSAQPAIYGDHDDILRAGDLELDESRWTVRRGGTPVELSKTEFQLLAYLMRHQGRVLTRAQLLENVWGWDYAGESQIVETYVSYLRRKLDPLGPPLIHTQRGVGYSLRLPEHAAAHRAHQARQTWQSRDEPGGSASGSGRPAPEPGDLIDRDPGGSTAVAAADLNERNDGASGGRDDPARRGAEPGHP
jgi:two-component system, OmpR family, response regulator